MRIHVIAVGRARGGPTAALFAEYTQRLPWPVSLHEVEARTGGAADRGQREAALLAARIPARATLVALDPRGRVLSSEALAERIGRWRDDGIREVRFLIGAADGHDDALRREAYLLLAFGEATWPHMLARAMLAEQLWRATSILANHPYHREG